jgi:hypothetical protein
MNKLFLLAFVVGSLSSFGQERLAIIQDKDGFVNVRASGDINSEIVGKISEGELFSYIEAKTEWFTVSKPTYRKPVEGFVHRSRIQPLDELSKQEVRKLLLGIFSKELSLIKARNFGEEYNNHHEPKFGFILNFAADFIIANQDEELMRLLIETIKLNTGSADEHPSWILGYIFLKSPDWTILQMKAVGLDKMLVESLEFGFANGTFDSKDDIRGLLDKIESLKKQYTQ